MVQGVGRNKNCLSTIGEGPMAKVLEESHYECGHWRKGLCSAAGKFKRRNARSKEDHSAEVTRRLKQCGFFKDRSRLERDFTDISVVGKGGFGQVMRATHKLDGQIYAVKVILFSVSARHAERRMHRFLREVQCLRRLDTHENIVRYFSSWLEVSSPLTFAFLDRGEPCGDGAQSDVVLKAVGRSQTSADFFHICRNTRTQLNWPYCSITAGDGLLSTGICSSTEFEATTAFIPLDAKAGFCNYRDRHCSVASLRRATRMGQKHAKDLGAGGKSAKFGNDDSLATSESFWCADSSEGRQDSSLQISFRLPSSALIDHGIGCVRRAGTNSEAYLGAVEDLEKQRNKLCKVRGFHVGEERSIHEKLGCIVDDESLGIHIHSEFFGLQDDKFQKGKTKNITVQRHSSATVWGNQGGKGKCKVRGVNKKYNAGKLPANHLRWKTKRLPLSNHNREGENKNENHKVHAMSTQIVARLYIQMEYYPSTLEDYIASTPVVGESRNTDILNMVVSGLLYCHKQGIMHRDIKPSNIFLSSDGKALIGDFGLACCPDGDGTPGEINILNDQMAKVENRFREAEVATNDNTETTSTAVTCNPASLRALDFYAFSGKSGHFLSTSRCDRRYHCNLKTCLYYSRHKNKDHGGCTKCVASELKPQNSSGLKTEMGTKGGAGFIELGTRRFMRRSSGDVRREYLVHDVMEDRHRTQGVGTSVYASPEQLLGRKYSLSVDVWALGMVALDLFTRSQTVMERSLILQRARDGVLPENLRERFPHVAAFCTDCLQVDPSKRPSSSQLYESVLNSWSVFGAYTSMGTSGLNSSSRRNKTISVVEQTSTNVRSAQQIGNVKCFIPTCKILPPPPSKLLTPSSPDESPFENRVRSCIGVFGHRHLSMPSQGDRWKAYGYTTLISEKKLGVSYGRSIFGGVSAVSRSLIQVLKSENNTDMPFIACRMYIHSTRGSWRRRTVTLDFFRSRLYIYTSERDAKPRVVYDLKGEEGFANLKICRKKLGDIFKSQSAQGHYRGNQFDAHIDSSLNLSQELCATANPAANAITLSIPISDKLSQLNSADNSSILIGGTGVDEMICESVVEMCVPQEVRVGMLTVQKDEKDSFGGASADLADFIDDPTNKGIVNFHAGDFGNDVANTVFLCLSGSPLYEDLNLCVTPEHVWRKIRFEADHLTGFRKFQMFHRLRCYQFLEKLVCVMESGGSIVTSVSMGEDKS